MKSRVEIEERISRLEMEISQSEEELVNASAVLEFRHWNRRIGVLEELINNLRWVLDD